jgi:hypothetical protein
MDIVYILSPEFRHQLYVSIRSLFTSGTSFRRVLILSVNGDVSWKVGGLPIHFENVDSISSEYWMLNKKYICDVKSDNIIFIDTDVIIQKPLNNLLDGDFDVTARRSTAYTLPSWDENAWKQYLQQNEVETELPVLNAGLLGFRNGIHQRIGKEWERYMRDAWRQRLFGNGYHADQWALPVALGRNGATCALLSAKDHAYAWEGDEPEEAVAYHTGASNFFGCVRKLQNPSFMRADLPIPRPNIFWHYVKDRMKRKWESMCKYGFKVYR